MQQRAGWCTLIGTIANIAQYTIVPFHFTAAGDDLRYFAEPNFCLKIYRQKLEFAASCIYVHHVSG